MSDRTVSKSFALALLLTYGCGEDKVEPPPVNVTVEPNQTLAAWPHGFDVYRVEGADKAIVFLHGGGGTKEYFAYQLGLKRDPGATNYAIANAQIFVDNRTIAVFPQGQAIAASPGAYTWNNHVMDSGQDDVSFIHDLVAYIASQYNVSVLYVVGHSNGGMMVNRIWCEAPELFDAYVAISGPPSEHFLGVQTPCSPATVKPFLSIVGGQDAVLQNADWGAQTWTIDPVVVQAAAPAFVDPVLIGERYFLPTRVALRCGGTVQAGDADAIKNGTAAKWSMCSGAIELIRVESGGHAVESLEAASGSSLLEFVFDFFKVLS